jgi:eukaryotic-like serine/threonine-protein kinase
MPVDPKEVQKLFLKAIELSSEERAEFLARHCVDNRELQGRIEALLLAHDNPEAFLAGPDLPDDETIDSAPIVPSSSSQDMTQDSSPIFTSGFDANDFDETKSMVHGGISQGMRISQRYTLLEKVGEGGMGEVWVARQHEPVKRKVAIKLIKAGMDSKAVLARFEQERQALAIMDHPNIASVFDGGITATGQPFFVMELVNGLSVTQFCDQMKLSPKERLKIFVPICQAVQHAHQKGIVHRDLKPANVLVTLVDGKPVPKVIDFGVAKATHGKLTEHTLSTQFGAVVGTLEYMSPEQSGFSAMDVDTRTDIYSLGVILYELLTGLRPIDSKRLKQAAMVEMIRIIQEEEPSKPSTRLSTSESLPSLAAMRQTDPRKLMALLRGELDWIVLKCLEKNRDRRYETANGLARDIQRYLDDEAVEARPPSSSYRLRKFVHRNTGAVVATVIILASLVLGTIGTAVGMLRARNAETNAIEKATEAEEARVATEKANDALRDSIERETERFELARKAIGVYHGEISKDLLLKEKNFRPLRTKLLQGAADFYDQLEALLLVETDIKSRSMLGNSYYDLGKITSDIGSKERALEVHKKGLAINRKLASREGATFADRFAVMRGLSEVAQLQLQFGNVEESEKSFLEALQIGETLVAEGVAPDDSLADDLLVGMGNLCNTLGMQYANDQSERAVEWYEKGKKWLTIVVDRSPGNVLARRELAYSLNNIGATYTAIGKTREALDLFTTCLEMREKLSKQFPDDISIQQDIGMTCANIAYANSLLGNAEVALAAERRAKTIRQSLYDENPAITDFQTGLAKSFDSDGFYFLKRGESLLAKDAFLEAAKYQSMAVEGNPDVVELRGTLARLYNNAGSAIARTDMKAATEQFQKALHVQEEIARLYPSFARYRSELAQSYQNVGLAMRFEKNFDSALANYEKAIKVLTELVEERPDVPEYKTDICKNLHNMAVIKNLSKSHEQALEILGRAIAMQKSLCERHPENPLYARELARSFNTRSEAYAGLDNLELALADRETAVEMLRKLVEAAPTNYDFGNGLSTGLSALGRIQMKMNKLLEAQQTLRGAIAQVRNLSQPSPSLIFRIAEDYGMLAKLGKMREEKDGERVEDDFASLALAALKEAVDAGYEDVQSAATNENFEVLFEDERFRALVAGK